MLKKTVLSLVALSLMTSAAQGTVIFRDPDSPTLAEINSGLQDCHAGVPDAKFCSYPGQVKVTASGTKIGPSDPKYILGDVLEPGTALPYVQDPAALLAAIKKSKSGNKVTIVSMRISDNLYLAQSGPIFGDFEHFIAVPVEVAELAVQNGMSAEDMFVYIQQGLGQTPDQIIADIEAQHSIIVGALETEIAALNTQIADLQTQIATLEETHKTVVEFLEAQIERLEADAIRQLLSNEAIKKELEISISRVIELEQIVASKDKTIEEKNMQIADLIKQIEELNNVSVSGAATLAQEYANKIVIYGGHDGSGTDTSPIHGIPNGLGNTVTGALGESVYTQVMEAIKDAVEDAYQNGYEDGYRDGYNAGYADGSSGLSRR